uniref:Uncharacterized protein n=1 Tax=Mus musculus TaxID=10090 RepID=Q3USZ0_MOUSE|nr:unnamed protein product [Mus musculus]
MEPFGSIHWNLMKSTAGIQLKPLVVPSLKPSVVLLIFTRLLCQEQVLHSTKRLLVRSPGRGDLPHNFPESEKVWERGNKTAHVLKILALQKASIQFFTTCLTVFLMKHFSIFLTEVLVFLTSVF